MFVPSEGSMISPIHRMSRMSSELGIDLRIKRDDLLPLYGGGNKVRKILSIVRRAEQEGCDALVTCGGLQSNHARATALAAAGRGWKCSLVLHGSSDRVESKGNLLLSQLAGAEIVVVRPREIGIAMRCAIDRLRSGGHRPLEVPGGGHCPEGAEAYADAVDELAFVGRDDGWAPDVIVLASGTGTTQAGIIAGIERAAWSTRVVGISVARRNPRGRDSVLSANAELRKLLGLEGRSPEIDFRDGWVCGGYEVYDERVLTAIRYAATAEGILLDPTYTGKAFAGLLDMVDAGEIQHGSSVLFWHTGGLPNLLASDLPAGRP